MMKAAGVIVAGGRGARLGLGEPKAFARVGGATLLARAEEALGALCERMVIAAPRDLALPPHRFPRVADEPGARGPLAGMVAGLRALGAASAIVLGVDFPLMRPATLAALLERLGGHGAVLPAPGGRLQPLAAAYGPGAGEGLAASLARGERSAVAAAVALDPLVIAGEELAGLEGGLESFLNLNTAADLAEAERRLAARAAAGVPGPRGAA
ncbi:MAG TPA: molybdenum cofactor guanylyltransferase [Candidatus Eisenbacteria bacterium]|jgi:molybdopterin-guanine dinucleotide biosynthesis protein A